MMKLTERLNKYLKWKGLSTYAFEKSIGLGNGYLGKQQKGKGSIGSDILEKIAGEYPDLNIAWLITGLGPMTQKAHKDDRKSEADELLLQEEIVEYRVKTQLLRLLKTQMKELQTSLPALRRPSSGKSRT